MMQPLKAIQLHPSSVRFTPGRVRYNFLML